MGGGIEMGNTCKPMAVSFQCMTKFTTNKKKKEWISDCKGTQGKNMEHVFFFFFKSEHLQTPWDGTHCFDDISLLWLPLLGR